MSNQAASPAIDISRSTLARRPSADAGTGGLSQMISFAIGDDQYGVQITAVREIKGWSQITHLPKQPEYVRGVLNLRGIMIPIIDLRCRFGGGLTQATPLHIVIVVQVEARIVGLLADRVSDIISFEPSQIQPVPRVSRNSRCEFLAGLVTVDTAMIALIDLANLLSHDDADDAANTLNAKFAGERPRDREN